jgi:hypothetical protein
MPSDPGRLVFPFPDTDAHLARSDFSVSDASLYHESRAAVPWGVEVRCDADGSPCSVCLQNGQVWSFCDLDARLIRETWPVFVRDYARWRSAGKGRMLARMEHVSPDAMRLSLESDNACLSDLLVWHYLPSPLRLLPRSAPRPGIHTR